MKRRNRPGNPGAATSTTPIADPQCNRLHRPEDGYAAPTAEARHEAALLAELHELGYRPATRCSRCRQWVVAPKSVALHMGPVCRAKSAAEVAE